MYLHIIISMILIVVHCQSCLVKLVGKHKLGISQVHVMFTHYLLTCILRDVILLVLCGSLIDFPSCSEDI